MHSIYWINSQEHLPDVRKSASKGMIAAGFDLSVSRLHEAYSKGMFPWFSDGDPVLWWSPDPRMVLECDKLYVSKNMAKLLRRIKRTEQKENNPVYVTTNLAFMQVIKKCAAPTKHRESTWINKPIKTIYYDWHLKGQVHSIEVWQNEELVAGLYGVLLGSFFFGESMFSQVSNMSKVALFYLVQRLKQLQIKYIDCQQETAHLYSMGARNMARIDFLNLLEQTQSKLTRPWQKGQVLQSGLVVPFANGG